MFGALRIWALLLFATGCGSDEYRWERSDWAAVISDEFSTPEAGTIILVLEEWFAAVPEARIPISISSDGANIHRPATPPALTENGVTLGTGTRVRVRLWPTEAGDMFEGVTRHEIGHFLGGYHIIDGVALVGSASRTSRPWGCISAADIASVCDGRGGCTEPTFPNCPE